MDAEPEYCWKCRDTTPAYKERQVEGIAIRCLVCGTCHDFMFYEDDLERPDVVSPLPDPPAAR